MIGQHALLSIGAVAYDGGVFHRKVTPCLGLEVDPAAAKVNGYSQEAWEDAVDLEVAMREFGGFLEKRPGNVQPLAHNAGFDRGWIDWAQDWTGIEVGLGHRWRCSMAALAFCQDAELLPAGKCSLDALAAIAGLPRPTVHCALDDARVCLEGYLWLLDKAGGAPVR